jgi:hypothetical protein
MHIYIHAYIHTYTHTCIYIIYTHSHMHALIRYEPYDTCMHWYEYQRAHMARVSEGSHGTAHSHYHFLSSPYPYMCTRVYQITENMWHVPKETLRSASSLPLRLSLSTHTHTYIHLHNTVLKMAESMGVSFITLHGRTASAKPADPVDFDAIRLVKQVPYLHVCVYVSEYTVSVATQWHPQISACE